MKITKAKLFWKISDPTKEIIAIPYTDNTEYYAFVKEKQDTGYCQVIITSETMICLIQRIFINQFRVFEIQMTESDDDLNTEISNLLCCADSQKPTRWSELITLLRFVTESTLIQIQRIRFKGRTANGIAVLGFIQSNGLLGVNEEAFGKVAEAIGKEIRKCWESIDSKDRGDGTT